MDNVVVQPMTEEFILWRCLHGGPLLCNTIDQLPADSPMPWEWRGTLPIFLSDVKARHEKMVSLVETMQMVADG